MSMVNLGKTATPIALPTGEMFVFTNDYMDFEELHFYDESDTELYKFTSIPIQKYRCLKYKKYLVNEPLVDEEKYNFVLYNTNKQTTGSTETKPLYETINIAGVFVYDNCQINITFWTNLAADDDEFGSSGYDSAKVLKFEQDVLEDALINTSPTRALCAVPISLEYLKVYKGSTSSGTPDLSTLQLQVVPIIKTKPIIIEEIKGYYPIVDFSAGGSGGGMTRHDHRDNNHCGFSFAIYHPGTDVPQYPWEK